MKKIIWIIFGFCIILISCTNNALNGYKWIEGTWEGKDNEYWGVVIVNKTTYKVVNSNQNGSPDEIHSVSEQPISISKILSHITYEKITAINPNCDNVGIDKKTKQIFIILGEYEKLYLKKVNEISLGDISNNDNISNNNNIKRVSPIRQFFSTAYGWKNDNLKGKVKKLEESLTEIGTKDETWRVIKGYDTLGRIIYYDREGYDPMHIRLKTSVIQLGFPMDNYIYQNTVWMDRDFLNPLHLLGYNAATNKRNEFVPPYTFSYNEDGLIDKIYSRGNLVYTCEYDNLGRFTKRFEKGLPTLQIIWDDNENHPSYQIKLYTEDGYTYESIRYLFSGTSVKTQSGGINGQDYYDTNNGMYDLDDYGNLTQAYIGDIFTFNYSDNKIQTMTSRSASYQYKYNHSGDMAECNNYIWKYNYDSHGNWIQATKYQVKTGDIIIEEEIETIIRKYEYYE